LGRFNQSNGSIFGEGLVALARNGRRQTVAIFMDVDILNIAVAIIPWCFFFW
jgi:hypothetical protein